MSSPVTHLTPTDPRNIRRTTLRYSDDIESNLRAEVLEKARNEFGYVGESFGAQGPLAKAIIKSGIEILDTAQVDAYRASRVKTEVFEPRKNTKKTIIVTVGTIFNATSLLSAWGYFFHFSMFDGLFGLFLMLPFVAMMGILFAFTSRFPDQIGTKFTRETFWTTYSLGSVSRQSNPAYRGYVPVHVLNSALVLRSELDDVNFDIIELTVKEFNSPLPLPNPFMLAKRGSEQYYIAVWDEREFESKM